MKNINWLVRIKNKAFWLAMIPAVLLLAKQVLLLFGIDFDYTTLSSHLTDIVETVFLILAILGIVNDPTTAGLSDSNLAQTYTSPKQDS